MGRPSIVVCGALLPNVSLTDLGSQPLFRICTANTGNDCIFSSCLRNLNVSFKSVSIS